MSREKPDTCSWCGDEVLWLRHERTQKLAPIDRYPDPDGNITVDRAARTYAVVGKREEPQPTLMDPDPEPIVDRHLNHWATCRAQTRRNAKGKLELPPEPPPDPGPALSPAELAQRAAEARRIIAAGNPPKEIPPWPQSESPTHAAQAPSSPAGS